MKKNSLTSDKILIISEVIEVAPYDLLSGAGHTGARNRERLTM